ncbi:MAG: serine hydrolase domain-containing protein [Gemmatimonadota bacterium]
MNSWRRFCSAVLASILSSSIAAAQQGLVRDDDPATYVARIEARQLPDRQGLDGYTIAELMQRFRVPGVSIAVIRDFRVHWAKGYGVADAETGRMVDTATLFQAASISKPVTAFAAARLVQAGKFTFDTDVNELLRSWKVPRNEKTGPSPVTLRSLFSHTSGSDDGFGFPGYAPNQPMPTLPQIILGEKPSNVGPVNFVRPPLTAFKYSGGGTTIVQMALTDVTGTPFAALMEREVLDPAGMTHSTFEQPVPETHRPRAARAHNGAGRSMGTPWHVYPEQAAAGLWTTPSDLARFLIEVQLAVAGRRTTALSQAMAKELTSPVGVGPYAVGLQVQRRGEGWYFSHSGGNWGFVCNMVAHLRKGYGFVIMINGDGGGQLMGEIEARVSAAYGWDILDKPLVR